MARIDQSEHYRSDFGSVFRSSSIFYVRQSREFSTTISFMNYWLAKRQLNVAVVASVRALDGRLLSRHEIPLQDGWVHNYKPQLPEGMSEGSVEIETFSGANMVIPYNAVMAIYASPNAISMVHSYARVYASHEVEEGRTLTEGEESCWTIRDNAKWESFAVLHNGNEPCPEQTMRIQIRNWRRETMEQSIHMPALAPFQSVILKPGSIFDKLLAFLDNKPGNASVSFQLKNAFTRMLVGNQSRDGLDFQVTHSNFNYARHETNKLTAGSGEDLSAWMAVPQLMDRQLSVLVYPDADPGHYEISWDGSEKASFKTGDLLSLALKNGEGRELRFSRQQSLPSRIVTALVVDNKSMLPAECSLGVVHAKRPGKRYFWSVCANDSQLRSRLVARPITVVYGTPPEDMRLSVKLYAQGSTEERHATISAKRLMEGAYVDELFPDAKAFLHGEFGYFSLFSDYPGWLVFSTLERAETACLALEHSF